jgi:hypothetical protein
MKINHLFEAQNSGSFDFDAKIQKKKDKIIKIFILSY